MYRPKEPFTTKAELFNPTYTTIKGVAKKVFNYDEPTDVINCSFKTYGGTELTDTDLYVVEDTGIIETWYRPDIKSNSQVKLNDKIYEVIGEPEDISLRHQFMKFKIKVVKGGA